MDKYQKIEQKAELNAYLNCVATQCFKISDNAKNVKAMSQFCKGHPYSDYKDEIYKRVISLAQRVRSYTVIKKGYPNCPGVATIYAYSNKEAREYARLTLGYDMRVYQVELIDWFK